MRAWFVYKEKMSLYFKKKRLFYTFLSYCETYRNQSGILKKTNETRKFKLISLAKENNFR